MKRLRVYLAGPDVFLRDAFDIAKRKKGICDDWGFEGVSPIDKEPPPEGLSNLRSAMKISRGNEALMDDCDLIIANMTPFRGPSLDAGTAFEMGYMRGRGKPVFGYSNTSATYLERVRECCPVDVTPREDGRYEDPYHMRIENFGLLDNLMLEGAVRATAEDVSIYTASPSRDVVFKDLEAFERCVARAAEILGVE